MKSVQKRIALLMATLLLLLSASPAAFAAGSGEPEPPRTEAAASNEQEPGLLPEVAPDDPFTYEITFEDDDVIVTPIPPEPQENVALPENASADVDWDAAFEAMQQALYTGEQVDVLDLRIPYTNENRSYISSNAWYNPRFLRTYANYSYTTVDNVRYISYFSAPQETSEVYRLKYDACMDAIDALMYGVKDDTQLSLADKCLILQDRLCAWCEYDYVNYIAKQNGAGAIPEDSYSPYGPLVLRTGVCNGIALAYNWMLDILGVENYYISSDAINHGWTMLYLDGEPYFVDVTWNDPVWDVPGNVSHQHFLLSFPTFSAGHRNATDFTDAPTSTLYENYFSKNAGSEILYVNGAMYYHQKGTDNLIKRLPDGTETVAATINRSFSYPYNDQGSMVTITASSTKMLAIGDTILYIEPRSVHAYNTVTGEDTVAYTPTDAIFPENSYRLIGLEQIDGVVYVYSNDNFGYNLGSSQAAAEAYLALSTDMRESFTFCDHSNMQLLGRLKGETCLVNGKARKICPDCGKIAYEDGEGVPGDHAYAAETVSAAALANPATCASPAKYFYSCVNCGRIENDPAHTFPNGEALPHIYDAVSTPATPACPGCVTLVCAECGAEAFGGFLFCEGNTACGTVGDTFAWQIVNGILSVCGEGALPDYSADAPAPWHAYADSITGICVNEGISSIGKYGFADLSLAETLTLPASLIGIGDYAFAEAASLKAFNAPENLDRIGAYAFKGVASLEEINYNSKIRQIGAYAFSGFSKIRELTVPASVPNFSNYIYSGCSNVERIVVEEGVTSLPGSFYSPANYREQSILEIVIPASVRTISTNTSQYVFQYVRAINVDGDNPNFASVDGVLYNKDLTKLIRYPGMKLNVYFIAPENVSEVSQGAFYSCWNIKYLDLSRTAVTVLPRYALYWFFGFTNVNLPAGLITLQSQNFASGYNPTNLRDIYIPSTVTDVASDAVSANNNGVKSMRIHTDSDTAAVIGTATAAGLQYVVEPGHQHAFSGVKYESAGTCAQPGVVIRACECGQIEIDEGVYAAHSYTAQTVSADALKTEASCSSAAVYYYSCAVCGAVEGNDSHTFTAGEPGAHSFTAETVKPEALKSGADCRSAAVYYYSCAVCGEVERNDAHTFTSGAAVPHAWEWITDREADCGNSGMKHETCSLCGDTRNEGTVIPATGNHSWSWVTDTPAACSTAGTRHEECAVCHEKRSLNTVIPATGSHSWSWVTDTPAACSTVGTRHEECAVCHEKRSLNTVIPATGNHNWTWIIDTPADCGNAGARHQECAVCGSKQSANTPIAATGNHSWNAGAVTRAANCTETGEKTFTCAVCGATRTESMGRTAHTDGNGDGFCDVCHTDLDAAGRCKYCGEKHTGFFGGIIKFFHSILYFFKNLFK